MVSTPGIEWTDDLKIGVPSVDTEHRRLVDIANDLLAAAHSEAPLGDLSAIIGRLIHHTAEHFVAEEKLLDRHGYPDLARHKLEHDRLMADARTLHTRVLGIADQNELRQFTVEAALFFKNWLLDHIRREDKPFRPFVMRLA
jgi:hemerythrin-like metal-binding protein